MPARPEVAGEQVQKARRRKQPGVKKIELDGRAPCGKWLRACHGNLHFQLDKGCAGLYTHTPLMASQPTSYSIFGRAAAAVNMQTGISFVALISVRSAGQSTLEATGSPPYSISCSIISPRPAAQDMKGPGMGMYI